MMRSVKLSLQNKPLTNPANLVTFFRIGLLLLIFFLIQADHKTLQLCCLAVVPVLFWLDSLDGYLARRYHCATKLGGALDVAGDRIVENVLWIMLAYFHMIPLWIPILVLIRGFITDSFRSLALTKGHSTFSMMKSRVGWWLVASPASRTSYAVLKAFFFTLGIGIWSFHAQQSAPLMFLFYSLLVLVLFQCAIRGFYAIRACLTCV
jgi:CDP-diacylglycerol--glycerol-3-phosphate 3-phosphatidyltransferase